MKKSTIIVWDALCSWDFIYYTLGRQHHNHRTDTSWALLSCASLERTPRSRETGLLCGCSNCSVHWKAIIHVKIYEMKCGGRFEQLWDCIAARSLWMARRLKHCRRTWSGHCDDGFSSSARLVSDDNLLHWRLLCSSCNLLIIIIIIKIKRIRSLQHRMYL